MAILFDDAASEYLEVNSTPVTAPPFTMACWFRTDVNSLLEVFMQLSDKDKDDTYFRFGCWGTQAGDPLVLATAAGASSSEVIQTTSGFSINTWHHACAVVTSTTSRAVFIDGAGKGTGTTSVAPPGIDRISIGRAGDSTPAAYFSGGVAEAAIWNVALSDAEVASLGIGFSPLFVRPESLVFYLPMIALGGAGTQYDWLGNLAMEEGSTPATSEHPPNIIYPQWLTTGYGIAALASALSGTLRLTGSMTAIPLSAEYEVFSSNVPRRTFSSG